VKRWDLCAKRSWPFGFLIGFGRASREGEGSWAGLGSGSPGVAG